MSVLVGKEPFLRHIHTVRGAPLPWSVTAMMFISFFGGAAAALAISLLNARRLRVSSTVRLKLGLWGALMLSCWWVSGIVLYGYGVELSEYWNPERITRRLNNLTGLLGWLGARRLLEPPARCFQARLEHPDEAWASPWRVGLVLALGLPLLAATPIALFAAAIQ